MIAYPETLLRVSPVEPITLEPAIEGVGRVRIVPFIGEEQKCKVEDVFSRLATISVPNRVTLKWIDDDDSTRYESYVELVSRHYFALDELRSYHQDVDEFGDVDKFPLEALYFARQAATDVFEQAAKRSFIHRVGRTKDYGRDSLINLKHGDVYELISEGYIQVSDSQLERGVFCRPYPYFIEYYYGADAMPAEVSRAVLELAAYILRPNNRPVGATGESSDAGYVHFTTAGRDGATSIPEVNAAIEQFGRGVQFAW